MAQEITFDKLSPELLKQHNPETFAAIQDGQITGEFDASRSIRIEELSPLAIFKMRPDLYAEIRGVDDETDEGIKEQVIASARSRVWYGDVLERKKEKAAEDDGGSDEKTVKDQVLEAVRGTRF